MDLVVDENETATHSHNEVLADNEKKVISILIVDDEFTNRIVLKGTLAKFGYNVLQAENGKIAVDVYRENRPDLVIMDVMMPEMDGYTAAALIKEEAGADELVPILFLTALIDEDSLAQCVEAGGDDFLSKPYSPVILKARVDALLRTRDLYRIKQLQHEKLSRYQQDIGYDLDIASRVLSKISNEEVLDVGNIKYYLSGMEILNGDIIFAANKPDGGQQFLLGDFTGHGLGAAIGGLVVFDVFRTMTAKGFSITQIIPEINRKLREILPTGRFLAAGLVELDPSHTVATIWNGGLPNIYIRSKDNDDPRFVTSSHLPLGVLAEAELDLRTETILIKHHDRIYLNSDGITELQNKSDEFFGDYRVKESVFEDVDGDEVFNHLMSNVEAFSEGREQTDDISVLEILCDPESVKSLDKKFKQYPTKHNATTWGLTFTIGVDTIKSQEVIPPLVQMLVDVQGLHHCRQQLYLIMTELFSNALEHGLLDIDSKLKSTPEGFVQYYATRESALDNLTEGTILFEIEHEPFNEGGLLKLRLSHDGDGFDIESTQELLADFDLNDAQYGRGIKLVRSLCERVDYEDFGRSVEVDFTWGNELAEELS